MSEIASSSSVPTSPDNTPPSSVSSPILDKAAFSYVSENDKLEAAHLKAAANKAFQNHEFPNAAHLYSLAINRNPMDPTLYCNRAYARMKIEEQGYAIDDATKAIELDPKYVKAYYRRALCQLAIARPQKAVIDFKKVLALEPQNKLARQQLDATQKLIRKAEFEKAIEVEEEQNAAERCVDIIKDAGGCELDKSYAGPQLEMTDGKYRITQEFVDSMLGWFEQGKTLPRRYVWEIILGCYNELLKEESLTELVLEQGITCDVIGDIHGQYYDMLHLLSLTGKPSNTHCLLFNGDFVDRGSWSIEVILTLFSYKWLYPHRVKLNRGNHETKSMNSVYGFEGEAKHKHGELTYKLFAHVFTALPLATLISASLPPLPSQCAILSPEGRKRYFVVHGGLFSHDGVTLDDIRKVPRLGQQPGNDGLMCELLWTDPQEMPGRGPSKRGVGIGFGPDVTKRWCKENGITGVIRSHEVRQGGYAIEHEGLCTTVFSAPNYVDQVGNKGAYIRIDANGTQSYFTFEAKEHPPMRPMAYASNMANMIM
ncbi:phosphoprotein phosphatase [Hysterangium stoloniferum]|nr:phosphoprotein phosphatase [Hysterangium stoloniferum]